MEISAIIKEGANIRKMCFYFLDLGLCKVVLTNTDQYPECFGMIFFCFSGKVFE